jgi:hypothetical protein
MKHKVGDKVKVRSKEWWNAQPKNASGSVDCGAEMFTDTMTSMCGKVVEISDVLKDTYFIKEYGLNWTDEMFEDSTLDNAETPQIFEQLIKDIAEVIKSHNLGVSVSENEGKLIIEPLEEKKEDDLPIDTPVMVSDTNSVDTFILRYYAGKGEVFCAGHHDDETEGTCHYDIIIPWDKFDPKDLGESMKFNIVK